VAAVERWPHWRIACAALYVVALATATVLWGFPASRDRVFVWGLAALVIAVAGRPHALARLAIDFTPVVVFLLGYDLLRGEAKGLVGHVFTEPQLRVDEWLFGGTVPTITLQRALWTPHHPHVLDYAAFGIYLTYFLLPFAIAAILWKYKHSEFRRYVSLWIGLSFTALITYALYPASPPWLAAKHGRLPHITRIAPYMSRHVGIDLSRVMGSSRFANQVAAVPSLHAAVSLFIALFFWSRTHRWRWLLVLYPLAMAFSLVYLGEHYVSDVLLGWIYAVVVFLVGNRIIDWWAARHARSTSTAPSSS
jgi:membrane-associated phospholipid phosphatase